MSNLLAFLPFFQASAPAPPPQPAIHRYVINRQLDRNFGSTPASGGGNVSPDTFIHDGDSWEVWQVIPFLGQGVVSGDRIGDARLHLRDRSISRSAMQLGDMPDRIIITANTFAESPWTFTRPTAANKFTSPGSGNSARRSIDYEPSGRVPRASPAASGIARVPANGQGQTFTLTIEWDAN